MQEHQCIIKSLFAHVSQNLKKTQFMSYTDLSFPALKQNKLDMRLFYMNYYFIQRSQDSSVSILTRPWTGWYWERDS